MKRITKSDYCESLDCLKRFWLKRNRPEEYVEPEDQTAAENGNLVGDLAKGLFGPYVEVPLSRDYEAMAEQTAALLRAGTPVICEASFIRDGLFCRADILRNLGDGAVELYEVKAVNALRDTHFEDIAFQTFVLREAGLDVRRACLVHLNKDYEREGELEIEKLFLIEDVTEAIRGRVAAVPARVEEMERTLEQEEAALPEISAACPCDIEKCCFWKYCSRRLPQPNVFALNGSRVKPVTKRKLYAKGLVSFEDVLLGGSLKDTQKKQIEVFLSGRPFVDPAGIRETLEQLRWPLYFLDFETYMLPVPPYDHIRPYMQVPFQYSLHFIEEEGGELQHREFLAEPGRDSRREIAEQLCRDIPADACVTAYNKQFECGRLKELADLFPDLAEHLLAIRDSIVDLETPFKDQDVVYPAMQGRSTIKLVLPALFPEDPQLDYQNLEGVHKGTEASAAFIAMADMDPEERENVRRQLLEYCGLDTLAMVKVWEKLRELAGEGGSREEKNNC